MPIPYVTTDQMREVDRAMIEDYHIVLIQMMENAGRNLAHLARQRFLNGDPRGKTVVVCCGRGSNGGGGLVAARRLHTWGASVVVALTHPPEAFQGVPEHQLDIVQRMGIPVLPPTQAHLAPEAAVYLDALIGYGLLGVPHGRAAEQIHWLNAQAAPVLSLDAPSGLDTTTGTAYDPTVRATATMTLALPKEGLRTATAEPFVGELYLADISVPPSVYSADALQLTVAPLFAQDEIIRLA